MSRKQRVAGLLAVMALLITAATPASAEPPPESGVVVRANAVTGGVFYFGSGYVVLTGNDDFAGSCTTGEGFVERTIVSVLPGNGSYQERMIHHDEPMLVFAADVNSIPEFFAWVGAACAAGAEPIATGIGRLDSHIQVDASGDVKIHNGVVGRVTTTDGRDVHVRTWVQYTVQSGVQDIKRLVVDYGG